MIYNTYTLANGLRVIHRPSASEVVYCGYQISAGTRNELPGEEGLAHFCEHVTFKGTHRRKAWHVINDLESVGGDLNAFTTKEDTVYYAAILGQHVGRAIDLLTDIVFHSVYPQAEIDKEVEVICDEIESYNDSPAELIYDEFENILFHGHALGHNVLGTADRVRSFTTADALSFTQRFYRPDNAVFFIDGHVDFGRIVRLLQKSFAIAATPLDLPCERPNLHRPCKSWAVSKLEAHLTAPSTFTIDRATHQAHVMLGCRAYDIHDDQRLVLYLLNNLLGGPGMNARLNVALRERRGLVYTVESSMVCYGDTGLWCTYFGCDPHDVDHCLRLVHRELQRLVADGLTPVQLGKARRQLKGQVGVACDNRENFALDFGKSYLHYGWEKDVDRLYAHLDAITEEQIRAVATHIFAPERLTTLIIK